jgi:diaminohydroxyphosphoribosylaminopyrimidine deaminase/5-amino-6-(5-phosphoribosylamino)uracil reductase
MTGINTILSDDAQLNVRELEVERQPLRVVLDSRLRMPLEAKILQGGKTLIYTADNNLIKINKLRDYGAEVVVLADGQRQVDLAAVLNDLAVRGCNEVLVEAGAILNGALLKAGLVDEMLLYIAPQLLGNAARGMADLGELTGLDQRVDLIFGDVRQIGCDLRITVKITT